MSKVIVLISSKKLNMTVVFLIVFLIGGRLRSILGLFRWFRAICQTVGWDGLDGMVIIGRRWSKSTFGANKAHTKHII